MKAPINKVMQYGAAFIHSCHGATARLEPSLTQEHDPIDSYSNPLGNSS
jgi:hypothetical protein